MPRLARLTSRDNAKLRPRVVDVRGARGPQLFRTKYGRLDVLRTSGTDDYQSLVRDAVLLRQAGHEVLVASLTAILRMKRAANRPKDRPAIIEIERVLAKGGGKPT